MFEIESPRSTGELRASLAKLHEEVTSMVVRLSTEEFHAPQGEHWSPAEHLRHLVTAIRALAGGMATPKVLLVLRFGINRKASRSFEEIRTLYRGALEAGGKASGRYDPSERSIDKEPEELRRWVMSRWVTAGRELDRALASWSERALDWYQAKHPLLGTMTMRELLYFTLYHNAHHARRVAERSSG